jgi:hypothetical protein
LPHAGRPVGNTRGVTVTAGFGLAGAGSFWQPASTTTASNFTTGLFMLEGRPAARTVNYKR